MTTTTVQTPPPPTSSTSTTRDPAAPRGAPRRRRRRSGDVTHALFLLPALVLFSLCITLPAAMGIFYSFTDSIGFGEFSFVGLMNYQVLFSDPGILQAYGFTLGFALCTVLVVNVVALGLALGLTSAIRARTALRTIFVVPMVVSQIIIAYVFQFIFSDPLPAAAAALGIGPLEQSILTNPDLAWIAVVLVTAWQATPQAMLIYTAGLMTIPKDLYEASSIDGASPRRQLATITLPLIAGYVLINMIVGFKDFLAAYDVIVGLTDGGPGTSTRSITMAIFSGFENGDYAYQMANATIFFLITLTIALVQLRFTRGKARV